MIYIEGLQPGPQRTHSPSDRADKGLGSRINDGALDVSSKYENSKTTGTGRLVGLRRLLKNSDRDLRPVSWFQIIRWRQTVGKETDRSGLLRCSHGKQTAESVALPTKPLRV